MKRLKAFTLIETLIYIGIFSIVALSLSGILWNTLQINSNQQAANEVDENLRYVLSVLNEKVRSSTAIDSATGSTLVLKGSVYQDADITFSVTDGVLYLQEGAGTPMAVTSNKVLVDSLTFNMIEMAGAKDGVSVDITLSYNSDKPELAFSKNLISVVNRVAAVTFEEGIFPNQNAAYPIGAEGSRWSSGYFSGNLDVGGNEILTGDLTVDTNTLYVNSASGYVGIGTVSPANRLTIQASATNTVPFSLFNPAGVVRMDVRLGTADNPQIRLYNSTNTQTVEIHGSGNSYFYGGNLGIGTTSPTEMLEVNGNIKLSGATATYKITNVATPTDSSDVATKGYVDAAGTTYTQYVQYFATSGIDTWTNPNGAATTTVSVIVVGGGGGGGGGGGNGIIGTTGGTGGTSSFGALASAGGGGGGVGGLTAVWNGSLGGAGYSEGQASSEGLLDNMLGLGGAGGVGFHGCGNGGAGGEGTKNGGGGGGSGYVDTYYGITTSASLTVTIGAEGGGGAVGDGEDGTDGSDGCVIVYWWDN